MLITYVQGYSVIRFRWSCYGQYRKKGSYRISFKLAVTSQATKALESRN